METKIIEPKLTQKQISEQIGFSDSTTKNYRYDTHMDDPSNRNKYKKKSITKTQQKSAQAKTRKTYPKRFFCIGKKT